MVESSNSANTADAVRTVVVRVRARTSHCQILAVGAVRGMHHADGDGHREIWPVRRAAIGDEPCLPSNTSFDVLAAREGDPFHVNPSPRRPESSAGGNTATPPALHTISACDAGEHGHVAPHRRHGTPLVPVCCWRSSLAVWTVTLSGGNNVEVTVGPTSRIASDGLGPLRSSSLADLGIAARQTPICTASSV